jgi:ribonuclease HII
MRREFGSVAGIDESGRGPLAGPLVACALHLPADTDLPGVMDSKTLSDRKRRALLEDITCTACGYGIGIVPPDEIDRLGMAESVRVSFRRAAAGLESVTDIYLIDGNPVSGLDFPCRFIVRGDARSLSIAAASIVAKVTRDDMMLDMHDLYPVYGFDMNKGYGTPAHLQALEEHGPCSIHRLSFAPLRNPGTGNQLQLPLDERREARPPWSNAEEFVVRELEAMGWHLEARNVRWRGGEVDIVVSRGDSVAFVEVKLFSPGFRELQLEKLDSKGPGRMVSASAEWIRQTGFHGSCRFDLALVRDGKEGFELEYIENAIQPPDDYLI